jgi:hypothetical protein
VGTLDWRGIGFRSLTENIDTTMAGGRLVFHLFGALAQFERDILRERTLAGLQAAARRGRKGGRPKAMDDAKIEAARRLLDSGMPVKDVAATLESASARSIATLASDGMGCRVRDTGRDRGAGRVGSCVLAEIVSQLVALIGTATEPRPSYPSAAAPAGPSCGLAHPGEAPLHLRRHTVLGEMTAPAVAGQYPGETLLGQPDHRRRQLHPAVPAGLAESLKAVALWIPGEMITGEQVGLVVEQAGRSTGVARHRNEEQLLVQGDDVPPGDLDVDVCRADLDIVAVHHALAAEMRPEAAMIGNIITMAEHHQAHTTQFFKPPHQRGSEARRVDEHVALRAADQIAGSAEAGGGMIPAVINLAINEVGKRGLGCCQVMGLAYSDRARRAGEQRHQGLVLLHLMTRLAIYS